MSSREAGKAVKGTFELISTEIVQFSVIALFYVFVAKTGALTETDLGVVSVLTFLSLVISTVITLSLPTALTKYVSEFLKKNEETRAAMIQKTVKTSVFALSTSGLIITIFLSRPISLFFWENTTYAPLIVLTAFNAYFQALMMLFNSNLQAFFLFGERAIVAVVWVGLSRFIGALLAFLKFGVYGVMIGYIAGSGAGFATSFLFNRGKAPSSTSYMPLRPLLKFSLPLFLGSIVLLGLNWADIVVLASITSDYAALGIYFLAANSVTFLSALYLPLTYTALPLLSGHHGVKNFQGIITTLRFVSKYLLYVMLPFCTALAVIAPSALSVFYGEQYAYGSVSFAVLSFAQILVAFYWVLSTTLTAIGRTSAVMKINVVTVFSYIALLLLLVPFFMGVGAASARFGVRVIGLALTVYLLNKDLKVEIDKESLWKSAVASIIIGPLLILTEHVFASFSLYITLAADLIVAAFVYLLLLRLLKALSHQDFDLLRQTFPSLTRYINIVETVIVG